MPDRSRLIPRAAGKLASSVISVYPRIPACVRASRIGDYRTRKRRLARAAPGYPARLSGMRRAPVSLHVAALLSPAESGQDGASHIERFQIFNACRPMELVLEDLSDDADRIVLSRESSRAATESRLRTARPFTADPERADFASRHVNVSAVGREFDISVWYGKKLTDAFGVFGPATTWQSNPMARRRCRLQPVEPLTTLGPVPCRAPARQGMDLRPPGGRALDVPWRPLDSGLGRGLTPPLLRT